MKYFVRPRTSRTCATILSLAVCLTASFSVDDVSAAGQKTVCTEARLADQQRDLQHFVQKHPEHQMAVVATIAEVENEFGGEVPRDQQCAVLDKVLEVLAGDVQRKTPIKR